MKRMKKERVILRIFILITVALTLVSCTQLLPANKICQTDVDCVPAQCCHAGEAVNRENAPDCSNTICTLECAPQTIDCGQGSVACQEGSCQVISHEEAI